MSTFMSPCKPQAKTKCKTESPNRLEQMQRSAKATGQSNVKGGRGGLGGGIRDSRLQAAPPFLLLLRSPHSHFGSRPFFFKMSSNGAAAGSKNHQWPVRLKLQRRGAARRPPSNYQIQSLKSLSFNCL